MEAPQRPLSKSPITLPFVETIQKATARAIADQRAMGLSIAIGKDGKVWQIPADQPMPEE